jgi:hypothetical protein
MVIFGGFVEFEAQYIWAMSFAYGKDHKWKNGLLKLACIGYIFIFGIMLTMGFFLSEIGYHESAATVLTNARTERNAEIDQYNKRINTLLLQSQNEATGKYKGFGNNAKYI